jgi:hypothetical protein
MYFEKPLLSLSDSLLNPSIIANVKPRMKIIKTAYMVKKATLIGFML